MMPESQPPTAKRSWTSLWSTNPITMTLATVGVLALLAGATMVAHAVGLIDFDLKSMFSDSDEAPIRVRNGSADFIILSKQRWEPVGSSGHWRMANAQRYREEFEVTIATKAGATCGGAVTATGSDIVVIYENDDDPATANTSKIVMQSAGRRTLVRPEGGVTMTWDSNTPAQLSYKATGGYIQSIAVGNGSNPATICSFTSRAQLDHMVILNVP